jgi:hypothetical protein
VWLHPALGRRVVTVRPFHAVTKEYQEFDTVEEVSVNRGKVGCVVNVQAGFFKNGPDSGMCHFGFVISVPTEEYSVCHRTLSSCLSIGG